MRVISKPPLRYTLINEVYPAGERMIAKIMEIICKS
jgi:hypothetical protein